MAQDPRSQSANRLSGPGARPSRRREPTARLIFNNRLDAAVTAILVVMVATILIESGLECARVISGSKSAATKESPFVLTKLAEEQA